MLSAPPVTRTLVAVALLALAAAPLSDAVAQPVDPVVTGRPAPGRVPDGPALPPTDRPDARSRSAAGLSPASAVFLSLGATAGAATVGYALDQRAGDQGLGATLIAVGAFVGPSVGNLALGNVRGALVGTGLRAGGAALVVGGVAASFGNDSAGPEVEVAIVTGLGLFAGGVVYDLVSAGRYAGRVTVTPTLGAGAPGAAVRVGL